MDARRQAELLEQYNLTLARIQDTKFYGVSFVSSYRALKRVYASDTYKNAPAANKVSMNRGLKIGFGTGEVNGKWLKALANVMESFSNAKPRVYTAKDVMPPLFRDLDGDGRLTSLDEDLLTLGVQPGAFVFNGSALTLAGGGTGSLAGLGGSGNTIRVGGGGGTCVGGGCAALGLAVVAGLLVGAAITMSQNPTKPTEAGNKPVAAPTTATGNPNPEDPCKGRTRPTLPDKNVVEQGGVKVEHYYRSNDHAPAHMHVTVNGKTLTRVGANGKPIPGDPPLPANIQRVIDDNLRAIRNAGDKLGRALKYDEECGEK